jgi:N6-adenosine-specific RNA methylase IME4
VGENFVFEPGAQVSQKLAYKTMSVAEIATLPVGNWAWPDASLYLWVPNAYVPRAYDVVRAWGFKPSTLCVWAKNPMGGGLGGTFGITTEFFLYARKGRPFDDRVTGTWFNWKRHYEGGHPSHSSKPDGFYDLVEQVSPGPYLEMFARRARLGWDYWGDESLETAQIEGSA